MDPRPILILVDDEPLILTALCRTFRSEPYQVRPLLSGQEAIDLITMDQNVFAVIADYRMPVMDGLVLLRQVRDLVPTALRIILSGFAARPLLQRAVRTNQIHHYITKPWRNEALRVIVRKGVPTASPSAE